MKKPKHRKPEPKFKVGQVVSEVGTKDSFLIRLLKIRWIPATGYEYLELYSWRSERYLRPLTAKEIGPRRK
jgi:hypothetical protein